MREILKQMFLSWFLLTLNFCFASGDKVTIVAAANFKPALDSILAVYKLQNPDENIQVTYGSSGKFYEQITNGAPFDLFFSADMNYPMKLREKKIAISPVKLYAIGRLVIWSRKINPEIDGMKSLSGPDVKKIAIANPATAPYGARAMEAMKFYHIYDEVKSRLVFGENIAQTAQFVVFGAADIGIIALSDALSQPMKIENGKYFVIPGESYKPLEQGCVILKHAKNNPSAAKFFDFISSGIAAGIISNFGYLLPNGK